MINQQTSKQIISLWVGKQSKLCAYNFYNLQAQQIFNEQQDPILQSSIWRHMNSNKLQPRMIIFDTEIERLAAVREVNNKKILKKMQKQENWNSIMGGGIFGQIDINPLQKNQRAQQNQNEWPQFSNWNDKQQNYMKIDKAFTSVPQTQKAIQNSNIATFKSNSTNTNVTYSPDLQAKRLATFEQFYKINHQQNENRIRRQLQRSDYLKVFSICSDQNYTGYTYKMIQHLREQCPKKIYMLTLLSNLYKDGTINSNMPVLSLSKLYDEVDILIPVNLPQNLKYSYFASKNNNIHRSLAPYFSSLLTPLATKNTDPYSYISSIVSDNRKLFNSCFTMPIIDTKMNLDYRTNIFSFQQAAFKSAEQNKDKVYLNLNHAKDTKQLSLANRDKDKNNKPKNPDSNAKQQVQQQNDPLQINFSNESYLSLVGSHKKGKFLSQSYILKGHFNKFQNLFKPKSQPSCLSIKYMQAIFSMPEQPITLYDKFYQPEYGQVVAAFPFQLLLFSHEVFGESLRKSIQGTKKNKLFSQEWPQSKQKILAIADSYLQLHQQSD